MLLLLLALGNHRRVQWDFGDGMNETTTIPTTSHTYADPGTIRSTLDGRQQQRHVNDVTSPEDGEQQWIAKGESIQTIVLGHLASSPLSRRATPTAREAMATSIASPSRMTRQERDRRQPRPRGHRHQPGQHDGGRGKQLQLPPSPS